MKTTLKKQLILFMLLFVFITNCQKKEITEPIKLSTNKPGANARVIVESYPKPTPVDPNFKYGINGHPFQWGPYYLPFHNNLDLQLQLLKRMGMNYYRIDIPHTIDPKNINYNSTTDGKLPIAERANFKLVLKKATQNKIKILPAIFIGPSVPDFKTSTGGADNYKAYNAYKVWTTNYAKELKEIENEIALELPGVSLPLIENFAIGNEEELRHYTLLKLIPGSNQALNGSSPSHYNDVHMQILAACYKGMIDGLKTQYTNPKTIINCSGEDRYGYHLSMIQKNVPFDIIGYHFYANADDTPTIAGNYFDQIFGNQIPGSSLLNTKDIWITEINKRPKSVGDEALTAEVMKTYIDRAARIPRIKAFFVYELFEQPEMSVPESKFGVTSWATAYNIVNYKPVFHTIKFEIEQRRYGYEDFVRSLFIYCNGRQIDDIDPGLTYWANRFKTENRTALIDEFLPHENYGRFVEEQFINLLNVGINSTDKQYFVNRLKNGLSRESLIAEICSGVDFWNLSGGTNAGFVERAFQKLLGRSAGSEGITYWTGRLNSGASRYTVISEIIKSDEYLRRFVKSQFNLLLRRNGVLDSTSENSWVNEMKNGMTQLELIKSLLNSYEYWQRGIWEGYQRRTGFVF